MDSFFARDILPLFDIRGRGGFLRVVAAVFVRSADLLDISSVARDAGVSRPTAVHHLDILDGCQLTVRVPPFHGGGRRELVRRPRVYALDTGLVRGARLTRRAREEYRVYFDRSATQSTAKLGGEQPVVEPT